MVPTLGAAVLFLLEVLLRLRILQTRGCPSLALEYSLSMKLSHSNRSLVG